MKPLRYNLIVASFRRPTTAIAFGSGLLVCLAVSAASGQRTDIFDTSREHPAIAYTTAPLNDAVAALNERLEQGSLRLAHEEQSGYLQSVLDALGIPIDTQSLVFSQTSAQAKWIRLDNPRAVYFNDTTAVGWVRGADVLELAAHDPRQGVVFYTLDQAASDSPRFKRDGTCLICHQVSETVGVPGYIILSTFQMADDPLAYAGGITVDHRSPLEQRWGGWYVTGSVGGVQHVGNIPVVVKAEELEKPPAPTPVLDSVQGLFDPRGYPTMHSDIVALMVFEHQAHMANLITRVGWEARVAVHGTSAAGGESSGSPAAARLTRVTDAARDLVDYLLFVNEAELTGRLEGSSGFAARFSAEGPHDSKGRSLKQLDLAKRLMRYPCSYMIYTPAFDALPAVAKDAVYRRLWQILSGEEKAPRYAHLSAADRVAIVEILRETKKDLPDYFG
jgi:hypothetical protein